MNDRGGYELRWLYRGEGHMRAFSSVDAAKQYAERHYASLATAAAERPSLRRRRSRR